MELRWMPKRPHDWDQQIRRFPNKNFGHESAWLDYLGSAYPRNPIEYFEIRDATRVVGYFCMARVKKYRFSLYRSPLAGAGRCLGLVVEPHVDQSELVRGLVELCKSNRIAHLEISNNWLDERLMRRMGFRVLPNVVHVCRLEGGERAVWARMQSRCRARIRKAEKNGLVAETTDDPGIVEVFYSQFTRVMERKHLPVPYSLTMARAMFRHLVPVDKLFAIRVKYRDRVIATGLYLHDDRALYYLDAGYDEDYLHLSPNELLHWTAMKLAIVRGIRSFQIGIGSPSRFTQKLGGDELPCPVYRKSFVPLLETVQTGYVVGRRMVHAVGRQLRTAWTTASGNGVSRGAASRTQWLVVVQSSQPELYKLLRGQVGDAAQVIIDRRQGERRRGRTASPPERRRRNRRLPDPSPLAAVYSPKTPVEEDDIESVSRQYPPSSARGDRPRGELVGPVSSAPAG